jgi:hypothetical protein
VAALNSSQHTHRSARRRAVTRSAAAAAAAAAGSSAVSSLDDAGVQLQQAAQYQLAYQTSQLSFGFSAGGLLFPYYLGVAEQLERMNILQPHTQLAGASAGSLIAACVKSGLSYPTLQDACFQLAK